MRLIVTIALGLLVFTACNRNTSQSKVDSEDNSLTPYQEYSPNPDEIVISGKLISFNDGTAEVEVIKQLSAGFGAKEVLNPGQKISLSSSKKPADQFICAMKSSDAMGQKQKSYRFITGGYGGGDRYGGGGGGYGGGRGG